jgi:hypothetical protein
MNVHVAYLAASQLYGAVTNQGCVEVAFCGIGGPGLERGHTGGELQRDRQSQERYARPAGKRQAHPVDSLLQQILQSIVQPARLECLVARTKGLLVIFGY